MLSNNVVKFQLLLHLRMARNGEGSEWLPLMMRVEQPFWSSISAIWPHGEVDF